MGILSSTLLKYFVKSFINHGVDAQLDDLPIVIPTAAERKAIIDKVMEIVHDQIKNPAHDFRPQLGELDKLIYSLYDIDDYEITDVSRWYRRRYPALFKGAAAPTP